MATHWEKVPGAPPAKYDFTDGGWLYYIEINQFKQGKIALVDGAGLAVRSNNSSVVPNDALVFKGATGVEKTRVIEFYGLSGGTAMVEARDNSGKLVVTMQVHVNPLSTKGPSWIRLDAPTAALNSHDTPVPYHMLQNFTIKKGEKAADILAKVPAGTKHLTISCHGTPDGVLSIGEELNNGNVDAFKALKDKKLKVIWIGGCSVAGGVGGMTFCQAIAKNAGCYVVAPGITLPYVRPPVGRIELFAGSLPKYFEPTPKIKKDERTGEDKEMPILWSEFFKKHTELGFDVE